jgi:hypothetical protein
MLWPLKSAPTAILIRLLGQLPKTRHIPSGDVIRVDIQQLKMNLLKDNVVIVEGKLKQN